MNKPCILCKYCLINHTGSKLAFSCVRNMFDNKPVGELDTCPEWYIHIHRAQVLRDLTHERTRAAQSN